MKQINNTVWAVAAFWFSLLSSQASAHSGHGLEDGTLAHVLAHGLWLFLGLSVLVLGALNVWLKFRLKLRKDN